MKYGPATVTLTAVLSLVAIGGAGTAKTDPPVVRTLPQLRGGQDLVGTKWPKAKFDRWIRGELIPKPEAEPEPAGDKEGAAEEPETPPVRVTLYRWWTDHCPYCERSLPAIDTLRKKYEPHGLRVVGVYHPKPPRAVRDQAIVEAANQRSFGGALALDQDWSVLRRLYLDTGRRSATSASFLVDEAGVIRFVHPGPEFFPSDLPGRSVQNDDYQLVEQAIRTLLGLEP